MSQGPVAIGLRLDHLIDTQTTLRQPVACIHVGLFLTHKPPGFYRLSNKLAVSSSIRRNLAYKAAWLPVLAFSWDDNSHKQFTSLR